MKKPYETPEVEIVKFSVEDILSTSGLIEDDWGSNELPGIQI